MLFKIHINFCDFCDFCAFYVLHHVGILNIFLCSSPVTYIAICDKYT